MDGKGLEQRKGRDFEELDLHDDVVVFDFDDYDGEK